MDWTKIQKEYIDGASTAELGRKYGCSQTWVSRKLRQLGTQMRAQKPYKKHHVDSTVFETLTEESAYWLGMFITDGCVHYPKRGGLPKVMLELKESDKDHVQRFSDFIKSSYPLYYNKTAKAWKVQVASQKLADVLAKWGIHPNKKTSQYSVHEGLKDNRHFWRGVIDGDGWISKGGRNFELSSGSEVLLNQFIDYYKSVYSRAKLSIGYTGHGCPRVGTSNQEFLEYLYKDSRVALSRKKTRVFEG
jgi:DNA-binding transcriptional regulator WhiA